jgi:23S rRNA (guanosine2251-2'-O)-methyltransferase
MDKQQKILVLHDIRSVLNVGAIFRTADSIGIDKIIISGITPAPVDRFGRDRSDMQKTALGAEKTVPWEQVENIIEEIEKYKTDGFQAVSLEQSEKSVDYKEYIPEEKTIVILGSEVEGVNDELLEISDTTLEIPMNGEKESLNVSVATGILLYRLFDR